MRGEVGVTRPPFLWGTGGVRSVRLRWAGHAHLAGGYRGCGDYAVEVGVERSPCWGYWGCGECAAEIGVSRPPCWGVPGV